MAAAAVVLGLPVAGCGSVAATDQPGGQLDPAVLACQSGCDVQAAQPAGSTTFLQIDAYPAAAYLLASRDDGRTWTTRRRPAGAGAYPRSQFFGPDAGITIGAGSQGAIGAGAYVTADGGQNWAAVPLGPAASNFDFVSTRSGLAWLAGPGSPEVYRTTDSGRTWTSITPTLRAGNVS
ncbi:MAG TPA: sialidase family protein [Streptosporangiaceae bacterium]|jgi:photosystem II stability/assembly factor-like uncharacterized protein